ncbi:ATP synthase subunit f, mitochondrial [Liparis tanakae]|uniref:ATP synthase subunit f, mitochondrial n=1 Tax=Liparis tanakae TaxID=230148 RepID=A0A4Z2GHS2_9TELE|nr:ATP synthase subunit f, mitochondrial [Liparis tanakae]
MSSEACPFCGKMFKRLKSHLPHCKAAAASSRTTPTKQDVAVIQTSTSSQPVEASCEPAAKSTRAPSATLSPQSKKSQKKSVVPSAATQPPSLPPLTKKRTANVQSSITSSLASAPSLPLSPTPPKPKKQSLRALIEAAKSEQVSKGSLAGTGSASSDPPSGSAPFVADPLRSRATAETGTNGERDSVKDDALLAFLATDPKHKDASKKASKKKKAVQSLPPATDTSRSLDAQVRESSARARVRGNFWVEDDEQVEDLSVNNVYSSGSGRHARITLQDVKATLGRADVARQPGRPSILNQIETADEISSVPLSAGRSVPTKTVSDQPPCSGLQHAELQSVTRNTLMSTQGSLIPRHQPELTSPAAPPLSSQVSKATPPLRPVATTEGLKVTGLLTISPSRPAFSSPLPAARLETPRAGDGWTSQREARKLNAADKGATGWQWYYRRYIDVKKGGAGGLGMLLAGYCVLGYIWSYPHLKRDRWRKYH